MREGHKNNILTRKIFRLAMPQKAPKYNSGFRMTLNIETTAFSIKPVVRVYISWTFPSQTPSLYEVRYVVIISS